MGVVILLGLFAMFFALMEGTGQIKYGLKISFGLIFLFLALRFNYGSDYKNYLALFQEINTYNKINFFTNSFRVEPGWIFLNWICKPIGFFGMTAVLALFNCTIYYRFIKKYVPTNYYWFSIFLYIFNPVFMLTHSTAMRQSIAIIIFIFSIDYIYKKNAIRYLLCIGAAALFHASALILLPVYLLRFFNQNINKKTAVIIFSIFLSIFIFNDFFNFNINQFIVIFFKQYKIYGEHEIGKMGTGLGIAFNIFLFLLVLYYEKFQVNESSFIFKISILYFLIIPFLFIIDLVGRIGMYFNPVTIAVYPLILIKMKDTLLRTIILITLIIFTIFTFFQFFYSPLWHSSFMKYQTIFSS